MLFPMGRRKASLCGLMSSIRPSSKIVITQVSQYLGMLWLILRKNC